MNSESYLYRWTAPVVMWLSGPWWRTFLSQEQFIGEWRIDSATGKRFFHIYAGADLKEDDDE